MKCSRIDFNGYKRLLKTGTNVDDRLVAFVGPNEAGKSTVLSALSWLDAPGSGALPPAWYTRGQAVSTIDDNDQIVSVSYRLSDTDLALLDDLDIEKPATRPTFKVIRYRDGDRLNWVKPKLQRRRAPFAAVANILGKAPKALQTSFDDDANSDEPLDMEAVHDEVLKILQDPDGDWPESKIALIEHLAGWLNGAGGVHASKTMGDGSAALTMTAAILRTEHPNETAKERLDGQRPKFREFLDEYRHLENEFDLNQDAGTISIPMRNVLTMAGTSIEEVMRLRHDEGGYDTHIGECNQRLNDWFKTAWSQSEMSLELKIELHLLKIRITVVKDGTKYFSTFGERSEGLKSFVALVAFLNALADRVPPILLIDEAETHLHIDAQADLIQVLQDEIAATQVFYTTHSPGCLPVDLGRGIRFVEPTDEHYASRITHNFWDSKYPGFSSVLFKMGAGAFAFSALRNAVLAEGASDMILLPALLRTATKRETLPYQIAPRLADINEDEVARDDVAAHVAYLVDGDGGGRDLAKHLRTKQRISRELITSHPRGFAVEDYVELTQLLEVTNGLRQDPLATSKPVTKADLPEGETIGQSIDRWFTAHHIEGPGKTAVSTALANIDDGVRLKAGAKVRLCRLHEELVAALAHRPSANAEPATAP